MLTMSIHNMFHTYATIAQHNPSIRIKLLDEFIWIELYAPNKAYYVAFKLRYSLESIDIISMGDNNGALNLLTLEYPYKLTTAKDVQMLFDWRAAEKFYLDSPDDPLLHTKFK